MYSLIGGIGCIIIGFIFGITLTGSLFNPIAIMLYIVGMMLIYTGANELEARKRLVEDAREINENTARVSKIIFKGQVVAKDKNSNTQGFDGNVRTTHSYATSVKIYDDSNKSHIIYFYDVSTYMECMEGDYVAVLITENLDQNGNVLKMEFEYMGEYKPYQDAKDRALRNVGFTGGEGEGVTVENIRHNGYLVR